MRCWDMSDCDNGGKDFYDLHGYYPEDRERQKASQDALALLELIIKKRKNNGDISHKSI
jgi:hypothetical protein